jgi:hypothetical protein
MSPSLNGFHKVLCRLPAVFYERRVGSPTLLLEVIPLLGCNTLYSPTLSPINFFRRTSEEFIVHYDIKAYVLCMGGHCASARLRWPGGCIRTDFVKRLK